MAVERILSVNGTYPGFGYTEIKAQPVPQNMLPAVIQPKLIQDTFEPSIETPKPTTKKPVKSLAIATYDAEAQRYYNSLSNMAANEKEGLYLMRLGDAQAAFSGDEYLETLKRNNPTQYVEELRLNHPEKYKQVVEEAVKPASTSTATTVANAATNAAKSGEKAAGKTKWGWIVGGIAAVGAALGGAKVYADNQAEEKKLEAALKDDELQLTPNEYALLSYLIINKDRAIPRMELLDKIWGYETEVETRVADDTVKRLRKKIVDSDAAISTVWGYGFRLENKNEVASE